MKHLNRAIAILGSKAALAKAVGVTKQAITYWDEYGVGKKYLDAVERATGGKVKASDLWNEKRGAA